MGKINIGAFIAARRKEKGLTQEELADYLGVSKPAVSKWESGQSYPDIMLLPVMASFFNASIDELLGYEAQLSKTEIRKLYDRLAAAFAAEPFDTVYKELQAYIRQYHSCWNLLYAMALLLINHSMLAGPERMADILHEASNLLEGIEKESGDPSLAKEALSLRAYCCLALNDAVSVIDLLGDDSAQQITHEILLAKAYAMRGEQDKSIGILQRFIYKSGVSVFSALPELMALYADNAEKTEASLRLALDIGTSLGIRETMPHQYFTLYLTAATVFAGAGNSGRALDMLEAYTDIVTDESIYPLKLRDSDFFDQLEAFYDTLSLGNHAPRNEKLIKKDLKDVVLNNPAFFNLMSDPRYRILLHRLEHIGD